MADQTENTEKTTSPKAGALPGASAPHASEVHDDFDDHAVEDPTTGGYRSPRSRTAAPHASERHTDFGDHAVENADRRAGGYVSAKTARKAQHVEDSPDFADHYVKDPRTGGYASRGARAAR